MTETALIRGLQAGDEHAFKELVHLYQDRVFNTSLGMLQNPSDAEDISQEVFIQVYRSAGNFRGESTLSTWIYRITVSKCLDHIRAVKRKKRLGFISSLFGQNNQPLHEPGNFEHPGVQLDKKENAAILFRHIQQLPEKQQTAFILNKLEDLSYAEIAAIMNTTESAVDSLLQRARQNLKKSLLNSGY